MCVPLLLEGRKKSEVELLAELRETKRRRQKYRSRTANKTAVQVVRDIIAEKMEHLVREWKVAATRDDNDDRHRRRIQGADTGR